MIKNIIYENDNFLIVNKPYNLAVHKGKNSTLNLIDILKMSKKYKNSYLELSHRLDKETSGCIVVSKNREFLIKFNNLMKNRKIKKEYIVLIQGKINTNKIELSQKILNKYNKKIPENETKTITKLKIIKEYNDFSIIQAFPITGKMHQIRIHLSHIGNPIANDKKYGSIIFNNYIKKIGLNRLFLHSNSIKFKCPISNKKFNIKAKYDNTLTLFCEKIRNQSDYAI